MKLTQILLTDIEEGFGEMKRGLCVLAVLELVLALVLVALTMASGIAKSDLSIDDVLTSIFGGMMIYDFTTNMPFNLPIAWLLMMALVLFLPLSYPLRDLSGFGLQVLVGTKNRLAWWLSKCIWLGLYSALVWLLALAISFTVSLVTSGSVDSGVSQDAASLLSLDTWDYVSVPRSAGLAPFVISACMMTWALCVAQLTLSLWIRPVLSFTVGALTMFASAFFFIPFLPGQYLMAGRSNLLIKSGVDPLMGLALAALIGAVSYAVGAIRFSHMDLVGKEYSS